MIFNGKSIQLSIREPGIAELKFDLQGESVNKINRLTMDELSEALTKLEAESSVKGLLVTSGKGVFIVGADIEEFIPLFKQPIPEILRYLQEAQGILNRLEDLPYPTVAAVGGYALGGGLEMAMGATYRVLSTSAVVGQPEVKLGLVPGFGGTVRLPRLIGGDNAVELIATGREVKPDEALKLGLVQAVVAPEKLEKAAIALLKRKMTTDDWKADTEIKKSPVWLNGMERIMAYTTAKGFIGAQAGPNYPAPMAAVKMMESAAADERGPALEKEAQAFADLSQTSEAESLIQLFFADQFLKKKAKGQTKSAKEVKRAAVLGAGIMGGGIAYQSATRGVPVIMKDINGEAIAAGLGEATRLLSGQMDRGKITREKMAEALTLIEGSLSYGDFSTVDLVVEAVIENRDIKKSVLAEVEAAVGDHAVIATNTSTISINSLADAVKNPARFCGMHFFNPVHRMPLVEVIRGKDTSDETIATVVAYAQKLGKTPVVVADCPGFLVNRILSPYMAAFQVLVAGGADIQAVDKTMEKYGWPMGPAFLTDVVGIDTAHHAGEVMAAADPERAAANGKSPNTMLYEAGYYGQKNEKGYYTYAKDKKGRPQKTYDPAVMELLKSAIKGGMEGISGEEVVERMMIPMIIEASRCLEEKIVETPTELDMALILGLGYPPFRGGLLRYADKIGVGELVNRAQTYEGPLFKTTKQMESLATAGKGFYTE